MILQDVNTLYIAFYGAGLSTITLFVLIITRYLDRRIRIEVRVSNGFAPFPPFRAEDASQVVIVEASNTGGRETTLGTMFFLLTVSGMKLYFPTPNYYRDPPNDQYEFAPGKSDLRVMVKVQVILETLKNNGYSGVVPFKAVFQGVANKTHESKEMYFDVEKAVVRRRP